MGKYEWSSSMKIKSTTPTFVGSQKKQVKYLGYKWPMGYLVLKHCSVFDMAEVKYSKSEITGNKKLLTYYVFSHSRS
jgi:hypothetical protein